jgi:DNA topoisomerase-6 subunit B
MIAEFCTELAGKKKQPNYQKILEEANPIEPKKTVEEEKPIENK